MSNLPVAKFLKTPSLKFLIHRAFVAALHFSQADTIEFFEDNEFKFGPDIGSVDLKDFYMQYRKYYAAKQLALDKQLTDVISFVPCVDCAAPRKSTGSALVSDDTPCADKHVRLIAGTSFISTKLACGTVLSRIKSSIEESLRLNSYPLQLPLVSGSFSYRQSLCISLPVADILPEDVYRYTPKVAARHEKNKDIVYTALISSLKSSEVKAFVSQRLPAQFNAFYVHAQSAASEKVHALPDCDCHAHSFLQFSREFSNVDYSDNVAVDVPGIRWNIDASTLVPSAWKDPAHEPPVKTT